MQLPQPVKVSSDGEPSIYGCMYSTDKECKLSGKHLKVRGDVLTISVPLVFQKQCRKEILTHFDTIQGWFNPRPSKNDIERYIVTPDVHTCTADKDKKVSGLKMTGILIDSGRIYPKYEVIWTEKPGLILSLKEPVEVTNLETESAYSSMDLNTPKSDAESDAESEYDEMSNTIRKIQDTIDIAREELAKLARRKRH